MVHTLCPNPSVDKLMRLTHLKAGSVHRSLEEIPWPGGKGVNVARVLQELDTTVRLFGLWGGPTGRWIRDECESLGIQTDGPQTDQWSRTCLTILSEDQQPETEIRERGPSVTGRHIDRLIRILADHVSDAPPVLCISGSWPPGTPDDVYKRLAERISTGTRLVVDASGQRLRQAIDVRPFAIHLNREEAEELLGQASTPAGLARQMLRYCRLVALTDGAEGLWLATDNDLLHAFCRVETVETTVGCGDALTAGLITALVRELPLEETARLAVASGAANCLTPAIGTVRKEDVEKLMEQSRVENVRE